MSLPVIAIIVASVSALFTGANMLVSALNYRRAKPRIKVKLHLWCPSEISWDSIKCNIRFISNSSTAVSVERVTLLQKVTNADFTCTKEIAVAILKGEEKREISSFDGPLWQGAIYAGSYKPLEGNPVTMLIQLGNGKIVKPDLLSRRRLTKWMELMSFMHESRQQLAMYENSARQLTFDDM
ncbi:hypothetical protein ACK389_05515 [Streptomyces antibioticus]|uniref:hypothetical protein n=1 Tax=Streptomyces antibioticus TaxID=1890 RepID=UPI000A995911